jgi:hypothetical protein
LYGWRSFWNSVTSPPRFPPGCGTMSWAGSRRELVTARRAPATPLTSAVCRIIRERKLRGRGNCSGSMCKAIYVQ